MRAAALRSTLTCFVQGGVRVHLCMPTGGIALCRIAITPAHLAAAGPGAVLAGERAAASAAAARTDAASLAGRCDRVAAATATAAAAAAAAAPLAAAVGQRHILAALFRRLGISACTSLGALMESLIDGRLGRSSRRVLESGSCSLERED